MRRGRAFRVRVEFPPVRVYLAAAAITRQQNTTELNLARHLWQRQLPPRRIATQDKDIRNFGMNLLCDRVFIWAGGVQGGNWVCSNAALALKRLFEQLSCSFFR